MKYGKVKCGCEKNILNELTFDSRGILIQNKDDFVLKKNIYEKGICKMCKQKLTFEMVE